MEVEVVFFCGDSVLVNLLWILPATEITYPLPLKAFLSG